MDAISFQKIVEAIVEEKRKELPKQELLISVNYLQTDWDGKDPELDEFYAKLRKDISVFINADLGVKFDQAREVLAKERADKLTADTVLLKHKRNFKPEDMFEESFLHVFIGGTPTTAAEDITLFQEVFAESVRMDELYCSIIQWDKQEAHNTTQLTTNLYDYTRECMSGVRR